MGIDRVCGFVSIAVLVGLAVACGGKPGVSVDDENWDEVTQEQRREHLERELATSFDTLESTDDALEWHRAAGDAQRALSLLRVEGGFDDQGAYEDLENELERLTNEPPFFAQ